VNPDLKKSYSRLALGLIIFIEVSFGVLYAVKTPRWEAPDEPAQFNYVRHVAETGTLPVLNLGDYDQAYLEKIKSQKFPPTLSIDPIRYESYEPPLYYLLAAPIYLAARSAGIDAVLVLRCFSVGLGAILLLLAHRVFVWVFPSNSFLALAGVGFMATVPMHVAMGAAINADTFAEVVLAVLLLVSLARARGAMGERNFLLLGGIVYGLVLLTSIKLYAGGLLLILAELAARGWRLEAKALRTLLLLFGLSLLVSVWWFARNALLYGGGDILGLARHDAVVAGQPTTVEWVSEHGLKNVLGDFFIITFKSFWAQFGWMGVLVNDRIYVGLFMLTAVAFLGTIAWIFRTTRDRVQDSAATWPVWVLLGAWLVAATSDHVLYNLHYFQPQGRYLFPALIPIAAFGVVGLNEFLDKRYAKLIFFLLYFVMLGLDYVSLYWFIVPQLSG
jgi:hypothetical protein